MRMQDSAAGCGPTAVHNALLSIGLSRSTHELEVLCGTSAVNGTSTRGLRRAVGTITGTLPLEIKERRSDVALLKLRHSLEAGSPVLLLWTLTDQGDHWVAAVGLLGDRFLIADSADLDLVLSLEADQLITSWACSGTYYGLAI